MLFRKQFELCKVEAGRDRIAIVSDLGTRREYIAAAFAAADELGADIYEMCVNCDPRLDQGRRARPSASARARSRR